MNNYIQTSIFDGTSESKTERAIRLLRLFEKSAIRRNPVGYVVGYSGGKDSDVLVDIFKKSGVKFIIIHNHTTLDAPETVYYIRRKFKEWREQGYDCRIYMSETNFWSLCLKKKMLPTRLARFCCAELKERDIPELRFATHAFGVRKSESVKRAKYRDTIEMRERKDYKDIQIFHFDDAEEVAQTSACYTKNYFIVNPLADWTEEDVWNYIKESHLEVNPLYEMGYNRVGCIGCPMAGKHRLEEFKRYPKYEARYRKLCDDLVKMKEFKQGNTGEELFAWWCEVKK